MALHADLYLDRIDLTRHVGAETCQVCRVDSLAELIDRGATEKERERIGQLARGVSGVRKVHAIRTRRFGSRFFVDLHILVDPEISVRLGHDISERVKQELIERGPEVLDVVVHLEPDE